MSTAPSWPESSEWLWRSALGSPPRLTPSRIRASPILPRLWALSDWGSSVAKSGPRIVRIGRAQPGHHAALQGFHGLGLGLALVVIAYKMQHAVRHQVHEMMIQ